MGFIEVLTKAPALLRRLNACRKKILEYRPDVLILIDYPTFNLKMASYARKHGIKTFYYIAPKVWASREWRIRKIKNNVDRLYVIFPLKRILCIKRYRCRLPWQPAAGSYAVRTWKNRFTGYIPHKNSNSDLCQSWLSCPEAGLKKLNSCFQKPYR